MDGRRLDRRLHLNGGTYNIGHRHPELIEVLNRGTQRFDMGNHHFPALGPHALAEKLANSCGGDLHYTIYGSGGAEAIDIASRPRATPSRSARSSPS
jgi:acetylornithine/succinyldiaminopimelate/putrescine aminotransferase